MYESVYNPKVCMHGWMERWTDVWNVHSCTKKNHGLFNLLNFLIVLTWTCDCGSVGPHTLKHFSASCSNFMTVVFKMLQNILNRGNKAGRVYPSGNWDRGGRTSQAAYCYTHLLLTHSPQRTIHCLLQIYEKRTIFGLYTQDPELDEGIKKEDMIW